LILNDKIKIIKKKIELLVVEIKKKYLIKKGLKTNQVHFYFLFFLVFLKLGSKSKSSLVSLDMRLR
jgi:hypothetical protein